MEESVSEEVEARKQKKDVKNSTIQIVKLEYVETESDENAKDSNHKNPHDTNPIPG